MRMAIGGTLLFGCCLWGSLLHFGDIEAVRKAWGDTGLLPSSTARFDDAREMLPRHGTVSYESPNEKPNVITGLLIARYQLTPLVVDDLQVRQIHLIDDGQNLRVITKEQLPAESHVETPKRNANSFAAVWLAWAWGLPWLAVFMLLRSAAPELPRKWSETVWLISVSWGASFGLSSLLFTFWNLLIGALTTTYLVLETFLFTTVLVLSRYKTSPMTMPILDGSEIEKAVGGRYRSVRAFAAIAFCLWIAITALECARWNELCPHGLNDAFTIWNLRARSLIRCSGDWAHAFHPDVLHADYPLMLPAGVARAWYFVDSEWPMVPQLIGTLFLSGLVAILVSWLSLMRGATVGLVVGIVILSERELRLQAMSQIADVPFAYCVAASISSWVLACRWPQFQRTAWLAAGLSLGGSLWLKNEGLTWAILFVCVVTCMSLRQFSRTMLTNRWLPLLTGMVTFLLARIVLYCVFPITNDLIQAQDSSVWNRLLDPARHGQIFATFLGRGLLVGPGLFVVLSIYAGLWGFRSDITWRSVVLGPLLLILAQLAVYYVAYLTSPHDLEWHLRPSLDRLLTHLWPTALGLFMLAVRSPEERLAHENALEVERRDFQTIAQLN